MQLTKVSPNAVYHSDCLTLLERLEPNKVDLVYLDPPRKISSSPSHSNDSFIQHLDLLSKVIQISRKVLTDSGSLLFHSEPKLTSNIRLLIDQVFGVENFRGEVIWPNRRIVKYPKKPGSHDVIWFYSKSDEYIYHQPVRPLMDFEAKQIYREEDSHGQYKLIDITVKGFRPEFEFEWRGYYPQKGRSWRYSRSTLDTLEAEGRIEFPTKGGLLKQRVYFSDKPVVEIGDIWDDLTPLYSSSTEYMNYPQQKPIALMERLIEMASNPDDLIVDPFCGTGTTLIAAQTLGRQWIGCDLSNVAVSVSKKRLREVLNLQAEHDYTYGKQSDLDKLPSFPIHYISLTTGFETLFGIEKQEKPLIITEGKTDWKHLKAALSSLEAVGKLRQLEVEFFEYEDDMGADELLKMCSHYARIPHNRVIIFVFDRDLPEYVKKVTEFGSNYRYWGNNVYLSSFKTSFNKLNLTNRINLQHIA